MEPFLLALSLTGSSTYPVTRNVSDEKKRISWSVVLSFGKFVNVSSCNSKFTCFTLFLLNDFYYLHENGTFRFFSILQSLVPQTTQKNLSLSPYP